MVCGIVFSRSFVVVVLLWVFSFFLMCTQISEEMPINLPCLEKRSTFHNTAGNKTGDTTRWHNGVLHTHFPFSPSQRTH